MAKTKTRQNVVSEERVEAKGNITSQLGAEAKQIQEKTKEEIIRNLISSTEDARKQLFGIEETLSRRVTGENMLSEGEEFELEDVETKVQATVEHQEYFKELLTGEGRRQLETEAEIKAMIEKILVEIKAIANASSEMKQIAKETVKHQLPAKPGKYHLNFFSWMLEVVKDARVRIESGANWLRLFSSKKRQQSYHGMRKRFNTSFTLSSERTTATQTG